MQEEYTVALFTRAWIEIDHIEAFDLTEFVALFTRAWIEIFVLLLHFGRGEVALFTRAWIEMVCASIDT